MKNDILQLSVQNIVHISYVNLRRQTAHNAMKYASAYNAFITNPVDNDSKDYKVFTAIVFLFCYIEIR